MSKSVKCKNCGEWNEISEKGPQKCTNCESIVQDPKSERLKKIKQYQKEQLDKWMFTIHENDHAFLKFSKKAGNIMYIVLMTIIGFFAWIAAILPI